MRQHIRQMLETNETKTWGEMRKMMLPEEIVEFYDSEQKQFTDSVYSRWHYITAIPSSNTYVRLLPEPPAKKVAPRYTVIKVCMDAPAWEWAGGYWAVQYANNAWMSVESVYAAGKTAVWHFEDGSTHPVFRWKGMVAVELHFAEDE